MFDSAKVTLNYKEFQELVETNNELKEKIKEQDKLIDEFIEEREHNTYVQALDKIEKILVKAYEAKPSKKNESISEAIDVYCETFGIPREELF